MRLTVILGLSLSVVTPASADNIVGDAVILRTLDRVTATTQDFTVPVGNTLDYGSLSVDVKHCEKKPPEEIPEAYAFLQIFEPKSEADIEADAVLAEPRLIDGRTRLFSGWMLASKPAVSALDHPVYDVWVLDCIKN
ncbi:MAG: DUF2155 domain-containing protein [Hyphomonadaceae bacterium]|nr:DUF2155 domain-containing protein [Hyphomonadaceae bacterium]MBC6412006.1 DUF2155 domain-containing protein [Hyphomonadaceae bacterium]